MQGNYQSTRELWLTDPEAFWAAAAEAIQWDRKWDLVLSGFRPFQRWFEGGVLNTCYNALDRHVENGRAEQTALIYDSPVTQTIANFTCRELRDQVARFAGVLRNLGVATGDRVIVYMPMIPEAVIAMLACARIGAVHSVVFGGFASKELATRIDDAEPKVIVTATCGIEPDRLVSYIPLLDHALELATAQPDACVVVQRAQQPVELKPGRDWDWQALMASAEPVGCVPLQATDPLYILYTSGTTGRPKGIVRDNGGHAVAMAWSMTNIYGVQPGEVFWAASDLGWAVGHSYIVYGPLINGNTTVLYEGKPVGTPDAGAFPRVIAQHGVKAFFTAPTAFRAIKREDPRGEKLRQHDLSGLRTLFLAGERCDPDTLVWAGEQLGVPVIDHWWQTETGWPIAANFAGLDLFPVRPGSCGKAVPGYDVQILDDEGREAPRGTLGNVAIRLPLPPGCLPTLWNKQDEYRDNYLTTYPGYYQTSDAGYLDAEDYLWIMGRTDDIINVAGHRLSTGGIEGVIAAHAEVAECAVIGVADLIKGELPLGLVVLKAGVVTPHEQLIGELVQMVRDSIGPVACFKQAMVVKRLPKTRSGKIVRGTVKKIADGQPYQMPPSIEDPAVIEEMVAALKNIGYPRPPAG